MWNSCTGYPCSQDEGCKGIGIDIDAIAAISAYDNARINKVGTRIETCCGDASLLQRNTYDVILANINRNILLQDMERFVSVMKPGATLILSGFYQADCQLLEEKANG